MKDLFRADAVNHQTSRLAGDVVLASSVSSKVMTALLVVILGGAAVFASTASYARKETVTGWLAPESGLIRLVAQRGGVLEEILVVEGDSVQPGTPIARIRLAADLASGDSYSAFSASLGAQRAAETSKAAARRDALSEELRDLGERRKNLSLERSQIQERIAIQRQRVEISEAEVRRAETIAAQGYLPTRELEARKSASLANQQDASELISSSLSVDRQIADVDARLNAIPIALRAAQAEAATATADLDLQDTQSESQAVYVIVATVAGQIAALPFAKGQTVTPGGAVAVVAEGSSPLEAELYAPSRSAGFVQEGQEVRLMYQAFPYQKFGAGRGTVATVSRTVLGPEEIAIPGLQIAEPVFRVRVTLDHSTVEAYGREVALQPGMLVNADVVIDRRSLLEWLLDPLYAAGRRA